MIGSQRAMITHLKPNLIALAIILSEIYLLYGRTDSLDKVMIAFSPTTYSLSLFLKQWAAVSTNPVKINPF